MANKKKSNSKKESPWKFQDICDKIDKIANELSKEIIKYYPKDLLHRAFWNNAYLNISGLNEAHSDHDRYIASQTLEFVQNYLISLEPNNAKQYSLDEKGWRKITKLVKKFNDHMIPFYILRSRDLQENSVEYDFERDALHTLDIMHWWGVRGNNFHIHHIAQVRELLLPQKEIFEDVFNYKVEEFLSGLEKIHHSLIFGFGNALEESFSLYEKTVEHAKELSGSQKYPTFAQLDDAIEETGVKDKAKDAFDRAFGLALCDVRNLTNLPLPFLDDLSWEIGKERDYWAPGLYAGWPLRVTPLRKRPFIKLDECYYCFDLHNLFDLTYRKIENLVFEKKPECREIWNIKRKEISEKLSLDYLSSLLPNAKVYGPVYYGKSNRSETDGLIIFDDVILIVEVKSGALDTGSPLLDFEKHQQKLVELIENPATQAKNFREYLTSNKEVEIYEGNHKNSPILAKLKFESFRKIYQCTVSVDNLTHLTSKARKLSSLGVEVHTSANWSISLDDLRVYAELFTSPLQFAHFLEQRELAESSNLVELHDELDHLGLYLGKNNYVRYADELIGDKGPGRIVWDSFTQEIDNYFNDLFFKKDFTRIKPNQAMPPIIQDIISVLEKQEKKGRTRAASFLLDGAQDYRDSIQNAVLQILNRQKEVKRLNPFFIGGEMSIACFCLDQKLKLPDKNWRDNYAKYRLLNSGGDEVLVLILQFDKDDRLIDVDFDFPSLGKATVMELERIRLWGERMKDSMTTYHVPTSKSR